jgi:hypothetical protein
MQAGFSYHYGYFYQVMIISFESIVYITIYFAIPHILRNIHVTGCRQMGTFFKHFGKLLLMYFEKSITTITRN